MTIKRWQGKYATIYLGDCFDILPRLDKHCADLLIVDPPYGNGWRSNHRKQQFSKINDDTGNFPLSELGKACSSTLYMNKHIYIFGFYSKEVPSTFNLGGTADLIWNKTKQGLGDLTSSWGNSYEPISFGTHCPFNSLRKAGNGKLSARIRKEAVLSVPKKNGRGVYKHPTEKPISLLSMLIESSSVVGDTVLDPVMGVGSTLVAATLLGRKSIGIEIEPKYVKIAIQRCKEAERIRDQIERL